MAEKTIKSLILENNQLKKEKQLKIQESSSSSSSSTIVSEIMQSKSQTEILKEELIKANREVSDLKKQLAQASLSSSNNFLTATATAAEESAKIRSLTSERHVLELELRREKDLSRENQKDFDYQNKKLKDKIAKLEEDLIKARDRLKEMKGTVATEKLSNAEKQELYALRIKYQHRNMVCNHELTAKISLFLFGWFFFFNV